MQLKELKKEKLKKYLEENKINAEIIDFNVPVITSEQAKKVVKGKIVKSILIFANIPYLCILFGEDRINFEKLKKQLKVDEIRIAKAKEVKEITGYDIGELHPFIENIKKIVDKKVCENLNEIVYCGGATHYSLLKIKISELLKGLKDYLILEIS